MSSSNGNGNETNNRLSDKEEARFEKLLPWLINGTLSEVEKNELEFALSQSEKLRKEKEILTRLQHQVTRQEMPNVPIEFAWQKMKRQIIDEKKLKQNQALNASVNSEKKWRYIGMAASVLLILQSSSLLVSWKQEEAYKPLSSNSTNVRNNAVQFTLQFVDAATALDIQQLLRENQLSVISGPSSIGLYRVSGPTDSINHAAKMLAQLKSRSDVITHVQQDE